MTFVPNIPKSKSLAPILDFSPKATVTSVSITLELIFPIPDFALFSVSILAPTLPTLITTLNSRNTRVEASSIWDTSVTDIITTSIDIHILISTTHGRVTRVRTSNVGDINAISKITSSDGISTLILTLDDRVTEVRASSIRDTSAAGRTTGFMNIDRDIIKVTSYENQENLTIRLDDEAYLPSLFLNPLSSSTPPIKPYPNNVNDNTTLLQAKVANYSLCLPSVGPARYWVKDLCYNYNNNFINDIYLLVNMRYIILVLYDEHIFLLVTVLYLINTLSDALRILMVKLWKNQGTSTRQSTIVIENPD